MEQRASHFRLVVTPTQVKKYLLWKDLFEILMSTGMLNIACTKRHKEGLNQTK